MDRRAAILALASTAIAGSSSAARRGEAVTIDRTIGEGPGKRPAVLLLHGSDGVTRLPQYRFAAGALSSQGYTVLFPHYFESTGDQRASYREIETKYPVWLRTLDGVLDEIEEDRSIDAGRIAVVGISLGGALALSLAGRDPRLGAVVSYFGFLPDDLSSGNRLTPTLILHGDADRLVPVRNATLIETTLRQRGALVEKQIYPGEGHGFSPSIQLDAAARTASFLRRHIGA